MARLTETQIERRVERAFDSLDKRLMLGWLTQDQYDEQARDIAAWADRAYGMPLMMADMPDDERSYDDFA